MNPTDPEPLLATPKDVEPPEPGSQPLHNLRHERFCHERARGASAAEAFRLAGYKHDYGNCIRLTGNDRVIERTSYLMRATAQKAAVTSERIIAELALIGFARMGDYAALLEAGDLRTITSEQSAAITEISVHTDVKGRKRARLKLSSKREALVDLGKAVGLFDDRPDITVPVTFLVQRTPRSDQRTDNEDDED